MDNLTTMIARAMDGVPEYDGFMTVDELNESTRSLADADGVEMFDGGTSRAGEQILGLKIGDGPRSALLYACPHPNEPVGALMADYLCRMLVDSAELQQLGFTWYIIKCVDPDSTRLNEGWFKGPFTPGNYARHYYRPPMHEQVEWTFPISYKTLNFSSPLPETQGLMKVIDQSRPDFVYGLHNCFFGGVYYFLSDPVPSLYGKLHELPQAEGLPLALGEPEIATMNQFADAIYQMPTAALAYDYAEQYYDGPPEEMFTGGTSSIDYVKQIKPESLLAVCEVPYFYEPRISDVTEVEMTRREVVLDTVRRGEQLLKFLQEQYGGIADRLTVESPFSTLAAETVKSGGKELKARRAWAEQSSDAQRKATVAECLNTDLFDFSLLQVLGTFRRMLDIELDAGNEAVASALDAVEQEFTARNERFEHSVDYEVVPIRTLVRLQLGVALYGAAVTAGIELA